LGQDRKKVHIIWLANGRNASSKRLQVYVNIKRAFNNLFKKKNNTAIF